MYSLKSIIINVQSLFLKISQMGSISRIPNWPTAITYPRALYLKYTY